jgi:hypothetical protein
MYEERIVSFVVAGFDDFFSCSKVRSLTTLQPPWRLSARRGRGREDPEYIAMIRESGIRIVETAARRPE